MNLFAKPKSFVQSFQHNRVGKEAGEISCRVRAVTLPSKVTEVIRITKFLRQGM